MKSGQPTPTLAMPSDYLARLVVKARGLQARVDEVDVTPASNPTDDRAIDSAQESRGDLSREELREEILGMSERGQAELVALFWLGRGDVEPEDWEATVEKARSEREAPASRYLLGQPLLGEHLAEGAERLGLNLGLAG